MRKKNKSRQEVKGKDRRIMRMFEKIRIKRKIRRLCALMQSAMNENDVIESVGNIKDALRRLPENKKEGLLDVCLRVLENER